MKKEDLTGYPNRELSLRVFNEEHLYLKRHSNSILKTLQELFIFTATQEQVLLKDLQEDLNEVQKWFIEI